MEDWKQLSNDWNLRLVVLLSLSLHTFLFFSAPLRKRTANSLVIFPIKLAYTIADDTANFAVAIITKGLGESFASSPVHSGPFSNPDLVLLWAAFMFLHLAGPDTIAAFELEDNELGFRFLLQMVFLFVIFDYVIKISTPRNKLSSSAPTFVFLAAAPKYMTKVRSLSSASLSGFRSTVLREQDHEPNYNPGAISSNEGRPTTVIPRVASPHELPNVSRLEDSEVVDEVPLPATLNIEVIPRVASPHESPRVTHLEDSGGVDEVSSNEGLPATLTEVIPRVASPNESPIASRLEDSDAVDEISSYEERSTTYMEVIPRVASPHQSPEVTRLEDSDVVRHAYLFFRIFKVLFVDLLLSFSDWKHSRSFFLERTASDAFKIVEVELNFFYDTLFTKVVMIVSKIVWFNRIFSFLYIVFAFVSFINNDKDGIHKVDVVITNTLFLCAIAQDIVAFLLIIFSDWTAAVRFEATNPTEVWKLLRKFYGLIVPPKRQPEEDSNTKHCACSVGWFKKIMRRRWSESLSQYNLVYCSLYTDFLDKIVYVKTMQFSEDLREFIFDELKEKSLKAKNLEIAKAICSAKGDYILRDEHGCESLLPYIETNYDEILIVWHVATELCYNIDRSNEKTKHFREISKVLSDYMLYLLIMEPAMMSVVAGISDIRFRDTRDQAKNIFLKSVKVKWREENQHLNMLRFLKIGNRQCFYCRLSKEVKRSVEEFFSRSLLHDSTLVSGDAVGKSVLFRACKLANELMKFEDEERKWVIISKVWVELLCYAASHCGASKLVGKVGKGGQLITVVWLLMAHFGLGDKFEKSGSF